MLDTHPTSMILKVRSLLNCVLKLLESFVNIV